MSQTTENLDILTAEEVAGMLRVDARTIYRKCEDNAIPHFRVGETGAIRFLRAKILQWIESQHKA